jgi:hypothetical protein
MNRHDQARLKAKVNSGGSIYLRYKLKNLHKTSVPNICAGSLKCDPHNCIYIHKPQLLSFYKTFNSQFPFDVQKSNKIS